MSARRVSCPFWFCLLKTLIPLHAQCELLLSVIVRRPSSVVRRQHFLKTTSPPKPLGQFWLNVIGMFLRWSPFVIVQINEFNSELWLPWQQNEKTLLVRIRWARSLDICYVASYESPLLRLFKLFPWGQNWIYIELYIGDFEHRLV